MRQVYRSKILASGELRQSKVQKVISNVWIGERLRNFYVTKIFCIDNVCHQHNFIISSFHVSCRDSNFNLGAAHMEVSWPG